MKEMRQMIEELIRKTRTYRRFYQEKTIDRETLKGLIDLARQSASAANFQPLKYIIVNEPEKNARVFPTLAWAGYLKDWPGPQEGERPAAYIVILHDTSITKKVDCDHGIAAQSIMLGATEKGLGGCMIGSIQRDQLRKELDIPGQFEILLVLALGEPKEKVVLTEIDKNGSIEYWRDENQTHYVPKRKLEDIIIE